jgi:hypothetical protein
MRCYVSGQFAPDISMERVALFFKIINLQRKYFSRSWEMKAERFVEMLGTDYPVMEVHYPRITESTTNLL